MVLYIKKEKLTTNLWSSKMDKNNIQYIHDFSDIHQSNK